MLKADFVSCMNGVKVCRYLLADHNPNGITLPPMRKKPLIAVTIHNTEDLPRVEDDGEQYTRATVNGNMRTVRTHFYVDDLCAWQNLELERCNWTCADGSGPGNMQTIAIECIMSGKDGEENVKARDNAARLAAYILHKYGLTANDLRTHTYWLHTKDGKTGDADKLCTMPHTYKTCPYYIIPDWQRFKAQVNAYIVELGGKAVEVVEKPADGFKVRVLDVALNIRSAPGTQSKVVGVITDGGIYTIVNTAMVGKIEWGRLKSGAGWISLGNKYVVKL
ncbi:MAG: N-acetylmuramoyl-L-alanine amidase [Oscillospiraceae bacterium]|nr:N-acetylmuramoyl-L-alanine amidase [Oscillospiraceae bacterium]